MQNYIKPVMVLKTLKKKQLLEIKKKDKKLCVTVKQLTI
jgi:hypothetical protein